MSGVWFCRLTSEMPARHRGQVRKGTGNTDVEFQEEAKVVTLRVALSFLNELLIVSLCLQSSNPRSGQQLQEPAAFWEACTVA